MARRGQLVVAAALLMVAMLGAEATFLRGNRGRYRPPKCPTKYVTMYETEVVEVSVSGSVGKEGEVMVKGAGKLKQVLGIWLRLGEG